MFNLNKNNMPYKNYEQQSDNTKVQPIIQQKNLGEYIPTESEKEYAKQQGYMYTPRGWKFVGTITQGKESSDEKTLNEKAKDYWHPIKGARQRWKASMSNETNPYVGIKKVVLPAIGIASVLSGLGPGYQMLKTAATAPHGWTNLVTNLAIDGAAGTAGAYVGEKIDKHIVGGTGEVGAVAGGLGSIYGVNKIPWKQDLNLATTRTLPNKKDIDQVFDRPETYEGDIAVDWKTRNAITWESRSNPYYFKDRKESFVKLFPNHKKVHLRQSDLEGGSSIYQFKQSKPNTIEFHLGNPKNPPKNSRDALGSVKTIINEEIPSGTYTTPDSRLQSRPARFYYEGVFSKAPKKTIINSPVSYDGYRALWLTGQSPKMQTDIAENAVFTDFHQPVNPKNIRLMRLHQEALKTKDLTKLNDYLVNKLHATPAELNNQGEIEFKVPIFYKK